MRVIAFARSAPSDLVTAAAGNPLRTAKLREMEPLPQHLRGFVEIIAKAIAEEILAERRAEASKCLEESRQAEQPAEVT
jgi:hypothetical protein